MRPEGISQQAWDEAENEIATSLTWLFPVASDHEPHARFILTATIARAIMAATERAALIAQNWQPPKQDITEPTKLYRPFEVADAIAAAIRQGSQPSNVSPVRGTVR
jgi:hypothetical protein